MRAWGEPGRSYRALQARMRDRPMRKLETWIPQPASDWGA